MKPIYLDYNAATPIDPQVVDAIGADAVRARETISAFRKDVIAKLYGGDVTRKNKLLINKKRARRR